MQRPKGRHLRAGGWLLAAWLLAVWLGAATGSVAQQAAVPAAEQRAFAGFDRNDYPGDSLLSGLRKSFSFTGYWLNAPPGETASTWRGKREPLRKRGFGFLLLWNGRLQVDLQGKDAAALGRADGAAAVAAAGQQGFPAGGLIFLDQEEGGRLLPEQSAYVLSFVESVRRAKWRVGVYCSGLPVPDGQGGMITTAQDISRLAGSLSGEQSIPLWVAREQCPPSPGCMVPSQPKRPSLALQMEDAVVWQYALSPRRPQFTAGCAKNYDPDGNCYPPGVSHGTMSFVDLDIADSPDPSGGR